MNLTTAQGIIARDRHRFRVLNCGRRFGKTTLSVEEIKGKLVYRQSRVAYIAPTYQQARDIAWEMLKRELTPIATSINESRLEIRVKNLKGTESVVVLRGWESIETLRGQAFDFIVIDEVAMMRNFWLYWLEVIRPTLADTRGEGLFTSTPKGFNHFYDLFNLEAKDSDFKSFHFTTYDNSHLPVDEIDKMKLEMTEDKFAQECMADFRKTEGLVFKEFMRSKHTYTGEMTLPFVETLVGVDFGWTNPTAAVNIKRTKDGIYVIDNEWYRIQQDNNQIIEQLKRYNCGSLYPDPEAPDRIAEMRRAGLPVREVNKGKDSVLNGINKLRELFNQNRILINANCLNLIWELETYHFKEKIQKGSLNEPEEPAKENDHAIDAMRYAIISDMVRSKPYLARVETFDPSQRDLREIMIGQPLPPIITSGETTAQIRARMDKETAELLRKEEVDRFYGRG